MAHSEYHFPAISLRMRSSKNFFKQASSMMCAKRFRLRERNLSPTGTTMERTTIRMRFQVMSSNSQHENASAPKRSELSDFAWMRQSKTSIQETLKAGLRPDSAPGSSKTKTQMPTTTASTTQVSSRGMVHGLRFFRTLQKEASLPQY